MITEVLAALRALPAIVDALNAVADATTAAAASARREEKDENIDDLIAAARQRRLERMSEPEVDGVRGSDPGGSGGVRGSSGDG